MRDLICSAYILPIDRPPQEDGWIEVAGGRIVGLGAGRPPGRARDLGRVAIMPGLVNAHTHLELSAYRGRVPPAANMVEWIRSLLAVRNPAAAPGAAAQLAAMQVAVAEIVTAGTVLVGDVSNSLATSEVIRSAGLGGVVFHEVLGFNAADPAMLVKDAWARVDALDPSRGAASPGSAEPAARRPAAHGRPRGLGAPHLGFSVVAHAPYSVSPALFTELARHRRQAPLTVHAAESADELSFLRTGGGPFRQLLEDLGVWNPSFAPPETDPVTYLKHLGYLTDGTLLVHAVHLTDAALELARDAGAVVVSCPRSNAWVGGGIPRIAHWFALGMRVAIGTDSLASAPSLSLFDELAEMRRLAPDVAASALLESATRIGAEALGFGHDYGTLAPGKRAALVAVDIPESVGDVEEYLVSGVPASAIHPLRL